VERQATRTEEDKKLLVETDEYLASDHSIMSRKKKLF